MARACSRLLRGCQARLRARVLGPHRRRRVAARGRRHLLPLLRRIRPLAGSARGRPPGQRLFGAASRLGDRPDVRKSARGHHRDPVAPPSRAARIAAPQRGRYRQDARCDRDGRRDQRDCRPAVAASRGSALNQRGRGGLAHVVARRLRGGARGRPARTCVVAAEAPGPEGTQARGGGAARRPHRDQRDHVAQRRAVGIPRVLRAALGGAPLRAARRESRDRDRGRVQRLEHDALRGALHLRIAHSQHPQHAAVHRRRGPVDPLSCSGRVGARANCGATRGLSFPPDRRRGYRAPAHRAQPARRGPAAPGRAGSSPPTRRRAEGAWRPG